MQGKIGNILPCKVLCNVHRSCGKMGDDATFSGELMSENIPLVP